MERLTDEYEVDLKKCIESGCEESCWWACLYIFDAIKKLSEYEDLGYSPEELKQRLELANNYEDLCK